MLEKLLKIGNISQLEAKIEDRIKKNRLIFRNKLQSAELKILSLIGELKNNEDYFKPCNNCGDNFSIDNLIEIDHDKYCQSCVDNLFYSCTACGEYIYNDDIQILEDNGYCQECYFIEKEKLFHDHFLTLIQLTKKKL